AEQHLSHGQRCLAAVIGAALHYCLVKQAFGSRGGDLAHDAVTAGGFTEDGDVVRVAIKRGDVFLHPAQCQLLVLQAGVGVAQGSVRQEAVGAEAVVQRDHDHAAFHQMPGIVARTTGTVDEGATMDPDHYRIVAGFFGTVYVQEQAVFIHTGFTERAGVLRAGAAARLAELYRLLMGRRKLGAGKAFGDAIANAAVHAHAGFFDTDVITLLGADLQRIGRRCGAATATATTAAATAGQTSAKTDRQHGGSQRSSEKTCGAGSILIMHGCYPCCYAIFSSNVLLSMTLEE